eukprot:3014631-Rhodomonas_salina.1
MTQTEGRKGEEERGRREGGGQEESGRRERGREGERGRREIGGEEDRSGWSGRAEESTRAVAVVRAAG